MKILGIILGVIGLLILFCCIGFYIYCNYGILEKDIRKGRYLDTAIEKPTDEFLPKIEEAYRLQPYSKLPPNPKILYETEDKIYWGYVQYEIFRTPVKDLYFTYKDENWTQFKIELEKDSIQ
ncbi:hypothetical protein [Dysgonomonas sp. Marseille-P4361]|uniref:hypothetical protein n=1 Tax=Dysgonomonas sp. Marseille-P4361 TaxID=2161820 RepID=UPI000D55E299|nr:hypothetical protein [Dysgonomonas sp. Marseille-P4361]